MDCVYCQLGETPCAVSVRGDYVPMQDVLDELDRWKVAGGQADHITLAGSGEPTLHTRFGDVFRWTKENTAIKSVLLTNGTMLHFPEVCREAAMADKVKVTLSAWDETSFQRIHRPAQGITFDLLVKGERAFRERYAGELAVEVFIVEGVNSQVSAVRRIAEVVESLHPDRIDINTVVRPPAVKGISAPPEEKLRVLADLFGEKASVTASFKKQGFASQEISEEALLGLIKRHPTTSGQLAVEFNLPEERIYKTLKQMETVGLLLAEKCGADTYYYHRTA